MTQRTHLLDGGSRRTHCGFVVNLTSRGYVKRDCADKRVDTTPYRIQSDCVRCNNSHDKAFAELHKRNSRALGDIFRKAMK